jgi:hypothetical protein
MNLVDEKPKKETQEKAPDNALTCGHCDAPLVMGRRDLMFPDGMAVVVIYCTACKKPVPASFRAMVAPRILNPGRMPPLA